jgi:3-phosphoshikimate 1-carboxyvinyltransferase
MMNTQARSETVAPARALGRLAPNIPGDKSISHRAVIFAAMAEGESHVTNVAPGEDVASSMRCVAALGATVVRDGLNVRIRGGAWRDPSEALDCGNSGTTMRFLIGALAGRGIAATLTGDESLSRRPMLRVAEPMRELGAVVDTASGGTAPVHVRGGHPLHGGHIVMKVASAQLASSLMLAATGANGRAIIRRRCCRTSASPCSVTVTTSSSTVRRRSGQRISGCPAIRRRRRFGSRRRRSCPARGSSWRTST